MPDTPEECFDINQCDYATQFVCMNDYQYRECLYGDGGCLYWDCGT